MTYKEFMTLSVEKFRESLTREELSTQKSKGFVIKPIKLNKNAKLTSGKSKVGMKEEIRRKLEVLKQDRSDQTLRNEPIFKIVPKVCIQLEFEV